jgi:selenocysteine-specific elongation factor
MHVLATAGHVDHGKSTLVHALTGMDPDRLVEEKARGLTIDLGFAWTTLSSGREIALVDVPGHIRFLKNMLAGVGAVDGCLFAMAATEGWKPQSEEHLRILDLLDLSGGVVAITKAALVSPAELDDCAADLQQRLNGSCLGTAAIVRTDAPTGMGLKELDSALETCLRRLRVAPDRGRPRLWIDRCFTRPGVGTVVTGTLTGGSMTVGDELHLVPGPRPHRRPLAVRVRSVQSHRRVLSAVGPGNRVALGLTGTGHDRLEWSKVERGQAVVRLEQWAPTAMLDASLRVLTQAPVPIARRGAYHAYFGAGEYAVRLRVLGASAIEPGAEGLVRLHLPACLPLLPGDRYVLRDSGRSATVGGGEVLDVAPVRPASSARPDRVVERVIAERGWVDVADLARLTGEHRSPTLGDRWVVDPDRLAAARRTLVTRVQGAGAGGLELAALDDREREVLRVLAGEGEISIHDGVATPKGSEAHLSAHPYVVALEAAPFSPPEPASFGVGPGELRRLVSAGLILERDGHYFSAEAMARGAERVAQLLVQHPGGITVAMVRDQLKTTRKHAVPFLSLLDALGFTSRQGDVRVAGPQLSDRLS